MWLLPRATPTPAHNGTAPAGAMVTPFPLPCGINFLSEHFQADKAMRDKCAPPGFEEYWWSSAGYYSPAICPTGYTAGCLRWNSQQGPPVEPTETAAQCVPSGYMCDTKHVSMAYSYSQTAPMIQVRWAESDLPSFATHPLYPGANPTNHLAPGAGNQPIHAAGVIAGRQASSGLGGSGLGFSLSTPLPTKPFTFTTTRSDSPAGTVRPGSDGTSFPKFNTNTNISSPSSGGLSTGAKAGIGIGVALGVLLLVGIGAFFFWRRRKNGNRAASTAGTAPTQVHGPGMSELGGHGAFEMPAQSTASPTVVGSEMGGPTPPPPAALAKYKNETAELGARNTSPPLRSKSELDGHGTWSNYSAVPELHGQDRPAYSELSPESRPYELATSQQPTPTSSPGISRKQVAGSPQQSTPMWNAPSPSAEEGPDPRVSIMPDGRGMPASPPAEQQMSFVAQPPTEPSPQELTSLQQQHDQLESRRQRLLELEKIEQEQASLQQKMGSMRGGNI